MAKVNQLFLCPKCEGPIDVSPKPDICPLCGFDLRMPGESFSSIVPPLTIFEQAHRHSDDMPVLMAVLKLSAEKSKNMLLDAYYVMKTLPVKKASEEDIRLMLEYASRIGEMAQGYKAFLDGGGRHTPDLLLSKKGDKNGENITT